MKRPFHRLLRFSSRSRDDIRREIEDEFSFHIETRTEALEREGFSAEAARARALREFGESERRSPACEAHGREVERRHAVSRWTADFGRDIRYGIRSTLRAPGIALVVVLTLAVAIAGNTTVFSVVNALLFKSTMIHDPDRVVRIHAGQTRMSWPNFQDIRQGNSVFQEVAAQANTVSAMTAGDEAARVTGARVTSNYFTTIETQAARGRTLLPSDSRTDLIVISDRLWHGRFGADTAIIGRRVALDGVMMEIIGVMPAGYRGLAPPGLSRDFWVPFPASPAGVADRRRPEVEVFGRLRPDVSLAHARAAMVVLGERLRTEYPDLNAGLPRTTLHGVEGIDAFRGLGSIIVPVFAFVGLLVFVAGLVLLVACANIAGLLLGRAAARRREIAIRLALGAGRGRLMRQLLAESLLLAGAGAALGLILSLWLTTLAARSTDRLPFRVEFDLAPDWRTLGYVVLVACATALLFGLAPARRAARTDLVPALKDDAGAAHQRFRRRLVTCQVFACTVLLLWASLFAGSLTNASRMDPGFIIDGVLVVNLDDGGTSPATPAVQHERFRTIQQQAAELPGVTAAGLAWSVPLGFMSREEHGARPTGMSDDMRRRVFANTISPGYLAALGIPLRAGRDVAWTDNSATPAVAIVNETAARAFWNGNAVGQRLTVPQEDSTIDLEIIGVAGDSKYWSPGEVVSPTIYRPMLQRTAGGMHLFVRTAGATATAAALKTELARLSPGMPVEIVSLAEATDASMLPARIGAAATAAFGAAAILLAVIGIYGLVAFSVSQRMRELGVRRAIGASGADIIRLVLAGSLGGVAVGVGPALLLGAASAFAFSGFLVEISPFDLRTLGGIAVLMFAAGAAASLGPAIRAARVHPLTVLRQD